MTRHQLLNAPMLLSSIFRRVFSDTPLQAPVARSPEPRGRVTYEDIALIFTTMRRPKSCRRFVASVRKHLPPEINIYIAVQGDPLCDYEALRSDPNVHLHSVPDDYGLSASRNYLFDHTSESVIFLCDDDFLMTENTRLDIALEIWNENSGIKILGGMFENFYYDENNKITKNEYTSFDNKIVRHKLLPCSTIFIPSQYLEKDYYYFDATYYFYYTDTVNNFALMDRTYMEEIGLRWDDNLKISGEHEDFYLKLKDRISPADNVVAFTNALFVEHHRHTNQHFNPLRERKEYHIESMEKSNSKTWTFVGKRSEKISSGTLDSSRHP